jgi:lipopolysaccharide transport system permease protein
MIIFSIFFGKIARIPSEGVPYPIFSYSGLLLWTYFGQAVGSASDSLLVDERLVSKTYCPRILIPCAATLSGLIDYLIASAILVCLMFYYHTTPSLYIFAIPIVIFFCWIFVTGFGFLLSSLNVKYRDIKYAVPFFIQLLIFLTPVIYPVSIIPQKFQWILMLNPMTGFIEAHRSLILGHQPFNWLSFSIAVSISILIFILGTIYFKATERFFADVI